MTEDDTFRRLKRIPYDEVIRLWHRRFMEYPGDKTMSRFLATTGWTLEELRREETKRFKGQFDNSI